ncbi:MAG: gamma-glutamyltransferase, partial [Vulcanimicrobiaceae bacterium]
MSRQSAAGHGSADLAAPKGGASYGQYFSEMLAPPRLSGHPTRAVARSIKGMIASPHALASAEGARILREGGNAVDAAIAANGVLSVVYPHANG